MAIIKYSILIILLFYPVAAQNDNIQIDANEVGAVIEHLEEVESEQKKSGNYSARFRYVPDEINEKWHYRNSFDLYNWRIGLRIDKNENDSPFQIANISLEKSIGDLKLFLGSIKIEIGQGLLFSSEYGRILSSSNIFGLSNNKFKLKSDLGSRQSTTIYGTIIQNNSTAFSHNLLIGTGKRGIVKDEQDNIVHFNSSSSAANQINRDILSYLLNYNNQYGNVGGIIATEIFSDDKSAIIDKYKISGSAFFHQEWGQFQLTGELGFQNKAIACIINISKKKENLKWSVQRRYLPTEWSTIRGYPAAQLNDGYNEKGWFLAVQYEKAWFGFRSWLSVFSEFDNEMNQPKNSGDDWMTYLYAKSKKLGKLEFSIRNRRNCENQEFILNELAHNYWAKLERYYYTIKYSLNSKANFVLKIKYMEYIPEIEDYESGYLITVSFPKFLFINSKIDYGFRYFNTDSWKSRIYDYTLGLPGEFRILPLYESGWELFIRGNYEISENIKIGLRYSYNWENIEGTTHESKFAIQFDYKI